MSTAPIRLASRAAFAEEAALIAFPWAIADRTYSPAEVWAAVDPKGFEVAHADFDAERAALA